MWKKKSLKYLCRWSPSIEKALQNEEMRGIGLYKNQKLHSENIIDKILTHLKVPSLGFFIFKRTRRKFDCLNSNFRCRSWRPCKEILCPASYEALEHKAQKFYERSNKNNFLSWNFWTNCSRDPWKAEHKKNLLCLADLQHNQNRLSAIFFCFGPYWSF
jgi:hypothetical protein